LPAASVLLQAMRHSPSGTVIGRSSIDGVTRLAAYANVNDHALPVAYTLEQSTYLSE
jgi:hypothetical protein